MQIERYSTTPKLPIIVAKKTNDSIVVQPNWVSVNGVIYNYDHHHAQTAEITTQGNSHNGTLQSPTYHDTHRQHHIYTTDSVVCIMESGGL